jgi:16S rRNA (guanine527-N7)-methyltransferase
MSWQDEIADAAEAADLRAAVPNLLRFIALFERWNRQINLSAARTPAQIAHHVVDCLSVVRFVRGAASVIDVGSGGGFPGIVISISLVNSSIQCTEPTHKKAAFLSTAVRELALANTRVVARRVDAAIDHGFDAAISRATFELSEWLALGESLVRAGGVVVGMEAREQLALDARDTRHRYALADRQRAVIVRQL